jgi:hypothetical protein
MKLTKADVKAIARDRYFPKIFKPIIYSTLITLILMTLFGILMPNPWMTISLAILFIIWMAYAIFLLCKQYKFIEDFVRRWEAGEISLDGIEKL